MEIIEGSLYVPWTEIYREKPEKGNRRTENIRGIVWVQ